MPSVTHIRGFLLMAGCWLALQPLRAQQAAPRAANAVYTYVQQPPHLPSSNSEADLVAAVQRNVVYPPHAREQGVAGKVFVRLAVNPEGNISNVSIARGLRPDCDSAAVAAVRRLPKLVPAQQNGRAVYYAFSLPVSFPPAPAATPQR